MPRIGDRVASRPGACVIVEGRFPQAGWRGPAKIVAFTDSAVDVETEGFGRSPGQRISVRYRDIEPFAGSRPASVFGSFGPGHQILRDEEDKPEKVLEAERLLADYYGEVVRPVSHYCESFGLWADALKASVERGDQTEDEALRFEEILTHLSALLIPIRKSNLLYRLIYLGEGLRTDPCPEHKGHWSGCTWDEEGSCQCQSGGDLTGWLPEKIS